MTDTSRNIRGGGGGRGGDMYIVSLEIGHKCLLKFGSEYPMRSHQYGSDRQCIKHSKAH